MSPIARDGKLPLQSKKAPERQASTLNSTDAMAMVEHGSEVSLNVTTPRWYKVYYNQHICWLSLK
ncbi:hypothetical protein HLBS07_35360 [Vibrio alginolyticus]|nr:hypothetical protein HLBS07_35360 [Vibrio alginolyticus]